MIAILEKYEHNQDFHQIVDFVEASHIRYALTFNPTVYISYIRQFWFTAKIETTKEGTKILVTVDGAVFPSVEVSHPHHHAALESKNPSFQGRIVPLFDFMLVPKGEGSGTPTESHHTPSPKAQQTSPTTHSSSSLPPVTTATIPPVIPTESLPTVIPSDNPPLRQYTRRTRIAQSLVLPPVADEPASPLGDDSQGEACPTDSGFEAAQDRTKIAKTSTLPSDSTPRVTSLAADKGSMQHKLDELTALCTSLQRQQSKMVAKFEAQELKINSLKARIKVLEDKYRGVAEQSGDDTPIKGRRLDEGEEAAKRVSDDTEEIATVLTSMDAKNILTSGGVQVVPTAAKVATTTVSIPTGSGVVSTASPIIPTVAPIFTTAIEEDQRMSEQIARDAEVTRIHAEEELQMMINRLDMSNETVAKYLQEYEQIPEDLSIGERIELISDLVKYQENYAQVLKYQTLQRKRRSKKQKKDYYMNQIEDFIPIGLKEKTKRFKRKGLRLEQESAKKLKTSEEVPEEVKSSEEVPEEKVKEMILVKESLSTRPAASDKEMELWVELKRLYEPYVKDQLWTHIQNLMHASVEWKLYDTCGVHHVTSKDKEIFMLVEKDYPFRKGLAIVMICYKLQGRIVGNKKHKVFALPVMEFPMSEEVPTASEENSHCQKKRDATAEKIALLLKSSSKC
uniref:Xylulose kinase-1 n=1 Tax=Tanacetum cinerariifolium TaxID=118510 RepID=A0A6L2MVE6_TANCI|nr:hypothetical protein [Tanacetum cinerariifolium]